MEIKKLAWNLINKMLAAYVMCILLVAMASSLLESSFGIIIMQFIMMCIFLGLPFFFMKKQGQADREKVQNGDFPADPMKGLKAGSSCFIILEITALILVLMKLGILPDAIYVYKILNPQFVGIAWFLAPDQTVLSVGWGRILCFVLLPLLYPLTVEAAYLIGYKDDSWI